MSSINYRTVARHNNRDIVLFRISDEYGAFVEILNYGASLFSIVVPDKNGKLENILLNYPVVEDNPKFSIRHKMLLFIFQVL